MRILPSIKVVLLSVVSALLSSCATGPDYSSGNQRPYVPRVSMPDPGSLSANERRYLPEVENALEAAGYRPTQGEAEYRLHIHLEDGPINADSHLTMFRGSSEIARANARVGGATMVFRRQQFVNESFQKCLSDFEVQIPRVGTGRSYNGGPGYGESLDRRSPTPTDRYETHAPEPQAEWQRGW
jgi:hypothetical protein